MASGKEDEISVGRRLTAAQVKERLRADIHGAHVAEAQRRLLPEGDVGAEMMQLARECTDHYPFVLVEYQPFKTKLAPAFVFEPRGIRSYSERNVAVRQLYGRPRVSPFNDEQAGTIKGLAEFLTYRFSLIPQELLAKKYSPSQKSQNGFDLKYFVYYVRPNLTAALWYMVRK